MKPAENAAWQALDQGLGRGLLFLFYMSIPMVIGLEAYGRFAFVQAAMLIVAQPVMLLGLDLIVVKRVARGDHGAFRDAPLARAGLVGATGVVVSRGRRARRSRRRDSGVALARHAGP